MAASHRSRLATVGTPASLDDRTWQDLDLDAVFGALDRTESTLGQHALYHRLRTAPVADELDAFEALLTRFKSDTALRERAQTVLSRLTDPQGYDLWWLHRQDAIETRPWYVLFPVLSAATVLLLVLVPFAPGVLPLLIAALLINLITRYLTDNQMASIALAFRQLAPVIATAESLRGFDWDDVRALAGALQAETPRLRRLKTISRWISGNPLMLPMNGGQRPF